MASQSQNHQSENDFIAEKLHEVGTLLDQQQASSFRVRAYHDAADYVRALERPVRDIYARDGRSGLEDLPTIGTSIAGAIIELLKTGDLGQLARLRGATEPEKLFQTVPMIGPALARAIHDTLDIDTLEALENAAPDVGTLLSVDAEYLETLETLPAITPRRFNDDGKARIPILHCERDHWRFTALFSNTGAAHRYGRTRDWVVIYFEKDHAPEGLATAVTHRGGPLDGRRVVRGREGECAAFYQKDRDCTDA